jgi:hypothetical protein
MKIFSKKKAREGKIRGWKSNEEKSTRRKQREGGREVERAKRKCDRKGLLGSWKGMGGKVQSEQYSPHWEKFLDRNGKDLLPRSGQGMFRNRKQMRGIIVKIKKMYCWSVIWRILVTK